MADRGESSEFGTFIIGAVLLIFLAYWALSPSLTRLYFVSAYYQYRGIEYVTEVLPIDNTNIKKSRAAIAKGLTRYGTRNFPAKELSGHLFLLKVVYGAIPFIYLVYLGFRLSKEKAHLYNYKLTLDEMDYMISGVYWQAAYLMGRRLDKRHPFRAKLRYPRRPWEYACEFGIIKTNDGDKIPMEYYPKEVNMVKPTAEERANYVFHEQVATQHFSHSLGPRIEVQSPADIINLPREYRIILVALISDIDSFFEDAAGKSIKWQKQAGMSYINRNKLFKKLVLKKTDVELPEITRENLNIDGVDEAIKKAFDIPSARKLLMSSGYANVLVFRLFEQSTLKSSYLLWAKFFNRSLWYAMNCARRARTPHTEGAGIYAHADWETESGRPQFVPRVQFAVQGLRNQLKKYYWLNT